MKSHASMNRLYRLVWNAALNIWVAVAENAKGRGKGGSSRSRVNVASNSVGGTGLASAGLAALSLLGACALLITAPAQAIVILAQASSTGGQVVAGSGTISQSANATTITQASSRLALDWNTFSTRANESITFVQPNAQAIALNRITGTSPSSLLGSLTANGQVFVLNPNGVLFGAGSQVNVGGLVASTLSLGNADFMAGKNTFTQSAGSTSASVVNQGTLTAASGGYIALLAPEVRNEGVISATLGTALLAAGNQVTLNLNNGSLLSYSIDQGALNALAENKQLIQADGGQVILSAKALDALSHASVNNSGIIEARTLQNKAGRILLMGDMAVGTVTLSGKLDASAPNTDGQGGLGGNGGFIETSAAHVKVADSAVVTTMAAPSGTGKSGTWLIDPVDFTIAASGGDMTGATLSNNLGTTDVTIQSTSGGAIGGTSGLGNLNVNDRVSWSANQLTLNAQNNININSVMNGSGTAKLALLYGQGALASGNTSTYNVNAAVNLPAGQNFSTMQGSNGTPIAYTVITTLGAAGSTTATNLQGILGNLAGKYVLGANIDASSTASWNGGTGFKQLSSNSNSQYFTGTFDGLGHTITGLSINRPQENFIGLFGFTWSGAVIQNIGLVGGSVTGNAYVGELVGVNYQGSIIRNSYATGSVTGQYSAGGLVGYNGNSSISNSYATGSVTSNNVAGGLVGTNYGNISNSYATGRVTSTSSPGGLVGTGNNQPTYIINSYWDIETSGQTQSRGGTGLTTAQMQTASSFSGWSMASTGASGQTWRIYEGKTAPLLTSFLTGLTLTDTATYNGTLQSGSSSTLSGVLGTPASGINAGVYSGNYYSNQQGYDISGGTLIIAKAPLTVTANDASILAGGAAYAGENGVVYNGFVVGDSSAVLAGSVQYAGTAQGASAAGSYVITPQGQSASNYALTFVNGALTIKPGNMAETALGGPTLVAAYTAALHDVAGTAPVGGVKNDSSSNAAFSSQTTAVTSSDASISTDTGQAATSQSLISLQGCGVSLPAGASCN